MKTIKAVILSVTWLLMVSAICHADSKPGKIHNHVNNKVQKVCAEENQPLKLDANGKVSCECLIALIDSPNSRVRCAAVYALGESRDPRAKDILIAQLGDGDHHMRRVAASALGKLQDPCALEPLLTLAKNQKEKVLVRCAAIRALGIICDPKALACLKDISANECRLLNANALAAIARISRDAGMDGVSTHTPVSQ